MKEIALTQDKVALVDDEDLDFLNQWKWCADNHSCTFYAMRRDRQVKGRQKRIYMHRLLLNVPDGIETDHIDGNGLNNTRHNLRLCIAGQNQWNRKGNADSTSRYKGVSWCKRTGKWQVQIQGNGISKWLGRFACEDEAALAYNWAAITVYGEFAKLNILEPMVKEGWNA